MEVKILQLIDGAKKAKGLTVIIDVFRAFSVACYAVDKGAKKIIPVGDLDIAYKLKKDNSDYILIGERDGRILPGCDFGNSPTEIADADLLGKVVVHTTTAGTQGIVNANDADEIITGSFVNAEAIISYIKQKNPQIVSLVCMGYAYEDEAKEDTLCAEYIKNALQGRVADHDKLKQILKKEAGERFFNPQNHDWSPESDFHLCTDFNRFKFVLKAQMGDDNLFYLKKVSA